MKDRKKVQVILVVIVLATSLLILHMLHDKKIENPLAVIYQNGEVIKTIDLSAITESYEFTIESEDGYNILKVDEEGISIIEASCPDKVCINAGHIHDSLVPITCLPNKLMIKIENALESKIDATAY